MSFSFVEVAGADITAEDMEAVKKATSGGSNRIKEPGEYELVLSEKIDSKKTLEERKKAGKDTNWASRGFVFKDPNTGKTFTSWEMAPVAGTTKHASDSDKWTAFSKFTKFIKGFGFEIPQDLLQSEVTAEVRKKLSAIINAAIREIFADDKGFVNTKFKVRLAYNGFHCRWEDVEIKGKKAAGHMLYDDKGQRVKAFLSHVEKNVGASGKHPFTEKEAVEKFMQEKKINLHKTHKTAKVNFDLEMRFFDIIKENKPEASKPAEAAKAPEAATPSPADEAPAEVEKQPWELD